MVLIIGADGYVGTNLVDTIESEHKNLKILCLTKQNKITLESNKPNTFTGDIVEYKSILNAFKNVTSVIHLASKISPKSIEEFDIVNHHGTQNVIRAMKENGVQKIVYLSSYDVTSDTKTMYSKSKLMAEKEIISSGLDYVILRPTVIYGGRKDPSLSKIVKHIRKFPVVPVIGNGRQILQPIFIRDIVKIAISSIDKCHSKLIVSIAGPDQASMYELFKIIGNSLKKRMVIIPVPYLLIKLSTIFILDKDKRRIYRDKLNLLRTDKVVDISNMNDTFSVKKTRLKKGINSLVNF